MTSPKHTFVAREPLDLIAAVPYVLGFHPRDSVVLMTFGSADAPTFHARIDLPIDEGAQREAVAQLSEVVVRHRVPRVALLVYTDDPWPAATFHDAAVWAFARARVEVLAVIRVGRERYHDAADPDDRGRRYDLREHRFTAEQVLAGTVVHRTREELAATLGPAEPEEISAVDEAARRFVAGVTGPFLVTSDQPHQERLRGHRSRHDLADHARWIQRTVRSRVRSGTPLPVEDAGRLLGLMSVVDLRDVAWAEMSRAVAGAHVDLWTDLVRRCPPALLPAPASLLAFAAWLKGHGALAWCALDRCVEVDPGYSMAECVAALLDGAVPPTAWPGIDESELRALGSDGPVAS